MPYGWEGKRGPGGVGLYTGGHKLRAETADTGISSGSLRCRTMSMGLYLPQCYMYCSVMHCDYYITVACLLEVAAGIRRIRCAVRRVDVNV